MTLLHMAFGAGAFWFFDRLHNLRKFNKYRHRSGYLRDFRRSGSFDGAYRVYDWERDR